MPAMGDVGVTERRTRVGRWKMMLVLAMCAAPVIASYLAYYVIRPHAQSVFGTLIDPQQPLPDLNGTALDGNQVNLRTLKGQWLLVTVGSGACDAGCQHYLYVQRQVRESLGREKERVDRVWLIDDAAPVPAALEPALMGATVLRVPKEPFGAPVSGRPPWQLDDAISGQSGHGGRGQSETRPGPPAACQRILGYGGTLT